MRIEDYQVGAATTAIYQDKLVYPTLGLAGECGELIAKMIDGSRATVWRRVKDHTLPQPIKVGGLTRWVVSEVHEAIEKRIAMRDQGEAA